MIITDLFDKSISISLSLISEITAEIRPIITPKNKMIKNIIFMKKFLK
jgi:hypothetical protein